MNLKDFRSALKHLTEAIDALEPEDAIETEVDIFDDGPVPETNPTDFPTSFGLGEPVGPLSGPTEPASMDATFGASNNDDLIEELNRIYTGILITQGIEGDLSTQVTEACSQEDILTERNLFQFDKSTRLAQLVGVCSLLIAQKQNDPKFQAYIEASRARRKLKLEIQQENNAAAMSLAQEYLSRVANNATSSAARNAATSLQ